MKHTYRILLALLILNFIGVAHGQAQNCIETSRTITTRWNSPQSLNTWNWTTAFYSDAYVKNRAQPTVLASPFFTPNTTFQNQNLIFLQSPNIKDCQPSDGWELLAKDFGNASNLPATAVTNPFFALYNRYSSTIRVFFLVVDPLSGTNNGATVSLQFDGSGLNESALLAHGQAIMPSVGRFRKAVSMRVPNRYANEQDYWLFADFPVAYDPCTCLFTSRLRFTVELIQSTNANLDISLNGTGSVKQVIKSGAGVGVSGTDFAILGTVDNLVASGAKGYKDYSGFQTGASGIVDFLSTVNGLSTKQKGDIGAFSNIMQLGNSIPYLGGLLGVFDFLMGGGRKDAKNAGPAAFEANLNFKITGSATGNLDLTSARGDRTIKTPGSLIDGSAATPTYDNVLGLFALLETPEVEFATYEDARTNGALGKDFTNPNYDPYCDRGYDENGYPLCEPPSYYSQIGVLDNRVKQFHLKEDLKYAINPAADLILDDLKFALMVENATYTYPSDGPGATYGFPTFAATFGDVYPYQSEEEKLNKMGYEPETDRRFRTPFLPAGCLGSTSIMVAQSVSRAVNYNEPKVYLKVRAVFKRKDAAPGIQPVIYLATYSVNVTRSAADPGNLKFDKFYGGEQESGVYPDGYYYFYKTPPVLPLPLPNIAGVANPTYPANCSRPVPAQTPAQLLGFCQNLNRYNPKIFNRTGTKSGQNSDNQVVLNSISCAPNPVSGLGQITYVLAQKSSVRIELLNSLGMVVKKIADLRDEDAGSHAVEFSASGLPAGLYHCTLQTATGRISTKVIIAE